MSISIYNFFRTNIGVYSQKEIVFGEVKILIFYFSVIPGFYCVDDLYLGFELFITTSWP